MKTGMEFFDIAKGHNVGLRTDNAKHMSDRKTVEGSDDVSTSFRDMFNSAIGKVNDLQTNSEELTRKMIYEPESVDIHTVTIAQQKAEVALTFLKSVRDEAVKAYRELSNLR
jgi:flagellar hook-basal body complex protein FliE